MQTVYSSLDELGCEFAVADIWSLDAGVDSFEFNRRFRQALPASVGWGDPNFDLLNFGIDGQHPSSSEALNVSIIDDYFAEWVEHNQVSFAQNDSRSNPNQVGENAQAKHNRNVDQDVVDTDWVKDALNQVNCQKQIGQNCPSEVGFWAKGLMHSPIITGGFVSQREVSND